MNGNTLRSRWQQLPEAVIRRGQAAQLRHYLRTVVLPFSAHYRRVFDERGLTAESFRTSADLQLLPFTTKLDLMPTPEQPQRFKDFIVVPDPAVLARRPSSIVGALLHDRLAAMKEGADD